MGSLLQNKKPVPIVEKKDGALKKQSGSGFWNAFFGFFEGFFEDAVDFLIFGKSSKKFEGYGSEGWLGKEDAFNQANYFGAYDKELNFFNSKHIVIPSRVASKIFSYTRSVNAEIGGLLVIEKTEKAIIISDALLFKQKVSSGNVELNPDNLAKQLSKIASKNPEKIEKIMGWWHSHNDMGTFWSSTDDACFKSFLAVSPVAFGIVVNKSGNLKLRLDVATDIGVVTVGNVDYYMGKVIHVPECVIEAKEKVRFFSFRDIFSLERLCNRRLKRNHIKRNEFWRNNKWISQDS